MKKLVVNLLFLAFCILLIHAGSLRLYDWHETGQLLVHKKQIFGSDYVSYNSDPVPLVLEFSLNLFFVFMGFIGIGSAYQSFARGD
jgi:hypothetical protein